MKNKTFISIVSWTLLWGLITNIYIVFGIGFGMMMLLYVLSGFTFTSLIIREEFLKEV